MIWLLHRTGSSLEDIHLSAHLHAIPSMPSPLPCPIGGVVRGSQPMARFYSTLDIADVMAGLLRQLYCACFVRLLRYDFPSNRNTVALSETRSNSAITNAGSPRYSVQSLKSTFVKNAVEPLPLRLSTTLYSMLGDSGYSRLSSLSNPNSSMISRSNDR